MPNIPFKYQVIGADDVLRAQAEINKSMKLSAEQALAVTKELENMRKASESAAARGIAGDALKNAEKETKSFGDALKSVSRDIDAVAGDGGAKFGKFASDVLGVAEALGQGGVAGAAVVVTGVVGLGALAWDAWKEHANKAFSEASASADAASKTIARVTALADAAAGYQSGDSRSAAELATARAALESKKELLRVEREYREAEADRLRAELEGEAAISLHRFQTNKVIEDHDRQAAELKKQEAVTQRDLDAVTGQHGVTVARETTEKQKQLWRDEFTWKMTLGQNSISALYQAQKLADDDHLHDQALQLQVATALMKFGQESFDLEMRNRDTRNARIIAQNNAEAAAAKKLRQVIVGQEIDDEIRHRNFLMQRDVDDAQREEAFTNRILDSRSQARKANYETDFTMQESMIAKREAAIGRTLFREREMVLRNKQQVADEEDRIAQAQRNQKTRETMGDDAGSIIATDNQITQAKIANRKAVTDATVAGLERQRAAEQQAMVQTIALQFAETNRAAAVMIAQPIFDEMLNSEKELLMVNRDTFQDYVHQDWKAVIAAKVQAILAGIAVEATAKAVMEGGESAAQFAAALGYLAFGDVPSATLAAASGAEHAAAAGVFASIAGASGAGAIGVGAARGKGGLVGTGEKVKDKVMGGKDDGPSFGGSNSGMGGGDTYNIFNYEAGSVDTSQRDDRNRQIADANADNARDVFATRRLKRAA